MKTLKKSKRFSIVEVIVVCAVVAILASLIMSASSSVREAGRKTTCLNNLKQIQSIYEAYRKDHRKAPAGDLVNHDDFSFAEDYVSESDLGTFICPGDNSNQLVSIGLDGLDGYTSYSYIPQEAVETDAVHGSILNGDYEVASNDRVALGTLKLVAFDNDDDNHKGNRNIVYFNGSGNSKSGIAQTLKAGTFDLAELASNKNANDENANDENANDENANDDNANDDNANDDNVGNNPNGNNGHGNNDDGVDSSNPGNSKEGEDSDPNVDDEHGHNEVSEEVLAAEQAQETAEEATQESIEADQEAQDAEEAEHDAKEAEKAAKDAKKDAEKALKNAKKGKNKDDIKEAEEALEAAKEAEKAAKEAKKDAEKAAKEAKERAEKAEEALEEAVEQAEEAKECVKKAKSNNGHGNNVDGVDSSNPGNSKQGEDSDPNVDDEKGHNHSEEEHEHCEHFEDDDVLGLIGGHFDVDTSSSAAKGSGNASTDGHVHEYDNKYEVTGIDCFSFNDSKLQSIDSVIGSGKRFILHKVNANLSTGANVVTDGSFGGVLSIDGAAGTQKLTKLEVNFAADVIANGGLHPTETGLVRSNTPGPGGAYRSGAYAIQALEVDEHGNALYKLGSDGAATSGLLWEVTLFWHYDPNKKK